MDEAQAPRASVRLTRKYAERIDGIDLSHNKVGDVIDLPVRDARMLILEGWAAPDEQPGSGAERPSEPRQRQPTARKT